MFGRIFVLATIVASFAAVASAQQTVNTQSATEEANINAYIDLLRSNVQLEKTLVLNAVMQFSDADAAVFRPIYKAYEEQMKKQGDARVAAIKEYAANYGSMTDAKADQLVSKFLALRAERDDLMRKCYREVRKKMGGKTAARFLQVESQLLLLIDLQIASSLPVVE